MIDKQKTRNFWEQVAESSTNDESLAGMLTDGDRYISRLRQEGEEQHFISAFNISPATRWLEVGTGGGRWAFFLSDKVKNVVGIDFSKKMIEIANQTLGRNSHHNITFKVAELIEYQSEQKFDVIYFSGMLQYLSDDEVRATLEHSKDLLAQGGYFISRDSVQGKNRVTLYTEHAVIYRTVAEYRDLFRSAGYEQTYNEISYPETRFSTFASKLHTSYKLPYPAAHLVQRILLLVNSMLGDPDWLKKPHHLDALNSDGVRDHRFFRYESIAN